LVIEYDFFTSIMGVYLGTLSKILSYIKVPKKMESKLLKRPPLTLQVPDMEYIAHETRSCTPKAKPQVSEISYKGRRSRKARRALA